VAGTAADRPISLYNSNWDAVLVMNISNNYLKNLIDTNNIRADITVNHDPVFYSSWVTPASSLSLRITIRTNISVTPA